jgi:hypothetical protein
MDTFMSNNRDPDERSLIQLKQSFLTTLSTVTAVFGDHSFHRWVPERGVWRNQVLAALFDAQMFACQYYRPDQLAPSATIVIERFKGLFRDDDFRRSIDAATNTPSYFRDRIGRLRDLFEENVAL